MLSKRLKEVRTEKEKTQQEIANYLGVTRPAYTAYESGNRQPDYETLQRLADYFNVTTDYLLGRTDARKESLRFVTGTGDGSFSFDKDIPIKVREEIINYAEYVIKKHEEKTKKGK